MGWHSCLLLGWSRRRKRNRRQSQKKLFPGLPNGPDFLWYTAGANDVWQSLGFETCERLAKSWEDVEKCMQGLVDKVQVCTSKMLKNFFDAFPAAKVLHSG